MGSGRLALMLVLLGGALRAQMLVSAGPGGAFQDRCHMLDLMAAPGQDVRVVAVAPELAAGSQTVEVWTRDGSFAGHATSASGWTRVAAVPAIGLGPGAVTPVALDDPVVVPAGGIRALAVQTDRTLASDASPGGVVAADVNLAIHAGASGDPWSATQTPRAWCGEIRYEPGPFSLPTTFAGASPTASCLFDVVAWGGRNVRLCSLDANLPASSCTVEVWTRPGTHLGHGTSPAGWQQLGGPVAVEGGGFGVPTPVPLALDLTVLAGTTQALAVLSSCGQQYSPGTVLGAVAASDLLLEVREGSEGPAWSATGSPAVWNGVLHHELPPAVSTGFGGSVPETGAMFNLRAAGGRDITIEHLDANLAAGPGTVELWTRPGSYVGFETSPAGWSLVGSAAVEGAGFGTPTRLPFGVSVVIPAGLTQGFHLHCDSGMQSSIGTAVGSPAAWDLFLSVEEGAGGGYFAATAAPRVWRGTVTYALDRTCITSGYAGGAIHESSMFEVTATGGLPVNLITMAVNLEAGLTTVEIWTRPGSFAGFESTIVGWNLVGVATITGLGPGTPTPIPILLNLTVPPGQTQSIHVSASNGQRYTTGVASGGIAVADSDLAILAGNGGSYFDAVATDRVWNGTLCYTAGRCLGLCGDCDLNGVAATITDALTAAQIDVGAVLPLAAQRACCDADGSGSVAILDALRLAQVAVGLGGVLACP